VFGKDCAAPLDRGHEAFPGSPILDGGHQDADRIVPDVGRDHVADSGIGDDLHMPLGGRCKDEHSDAARS